MKTVNQKLKPIIFQLIFYPAVFLFTVVAYVAVKPLSLGNDLLPDGEVAQAVGVLGLCAVTLTGILLKKYGKLNDERLMLLLVIGGYFIRLAYMLYTPYTVRQHDTSGDYGHKAYAQILFNTGKLPTTNYYQFYHPPLNAFIQSCFMKLTLPVFTFLNEIFPSLCLDVSPDGLFESCQILSLLYMTVTVVEGLKIIKNLSIGRLSGLFASIFVIFFPRLIQLSGQLNNDGLSIMFAFIALNQAIVFYKSQSYPSIIICAFAVGLGMMAKLNSATICLPIAILFLQVFVKRIVAKSPAPVWDITVKYVLFLVISVPLALWFHLYAKERFGQGFGYVFDNLNPNLSVSHVSPFYRFFLPGFYHIFSTPFADAWTDYNLFDYLIKSSMFGEFSFSQGSGIAYGAVIVNYAFTVTFILSLILYFIHVKKTGASLFTLSNVVSLSVGATMALCQLYFNIAMPYGCTMDFRYIVPIILFVAITGGEMYESSRMTKVPLFKGISQLNIILGGLMLVLTNLFYLVAV